MLPWTQADFWKHKFVRNTTVFILQFLTDSIIDLFKRLFRLSQFPEVLSLDFKQNTFGAVAS